MRNIVWEFVKITVMVLFCWNTALEYFPPTGFGCSECEAIAAKLGDFVFGFVPGAMAYGL